MEIKSHNDFIAAIEAYYGMQYVSDNEIRILQDYLKNHYTDVQLEALFFECITHHSKKWKTLPDVAIFQEIVSEKHKCVTEGKAEIAWRSLLSVSSTNDVLIVDPIAHGVVSGYGTWAHFCDERDNNREWTHKDFVKRYMTTAQFNVYGTPYVLKGFYSVEYGASFQGVQIRIIGNEAEGKKLLDGNGHQHEPAQLLNFFERVNQQ
jgi:hypothetical protein